MNLKETPEIVAWPETHYVFLERTGSVPENARLTWQEFQRLVGELKRAAVVTGFLSLYKMDPLVYRAGASVANEPKRLPGTLRYERFEGGKYARFILPGSYSQLPKATIRVLEIVSENCALPATLSILQMTRRLPGRRSWLRKYCFLSHAPQINPRRE